MNIEQLVDMAEYLGFPTEGEFAEELWRTLSGQYGLPTSMAADVYRMCGYKPFCGYPLVRLPETDGVRYTTRTPHAILVLGTIK